MGCCCAKDEKKPPAGHSTEPFGAEGKIKGEKQQQQQKQSGPKETSPSSSPKAGKYKKEQREAMLDIVDTTAEKVRDAFHSNAFFNKLEARFKEAFYDSSGDTIGALESNVDWKQKWKGVPFGAAMREKFFTLPEHYLTGCSFGATPLPVVEARKQWDHANQLNPVAWRFMMLPIRLRQAEQRLSKDIRSDPSDTKIVMNEQYGLSAILKSLPWQIGDRVVTFKNSETSDTRAALTWLRRARGVDVIELPLCTPLTDDEILAGVKEALATMKKEGHPPVFSVFSHVTDTAWVLPAKKLTELFHQYTTSVAVDGSHALGNVRVDTADIASDWYYGSAHRWLHTCPGVGFIVAKPLKYACTRPLTVSYHDMGGYAKEFTYYGLQDFSTWCSVLDSFDFLEKACGGLDNARNYCAKQAAAAVKTLSNAWGTKVFQVDKDGKEHYGCMPVIPLPHGDKADESFVREAAKALGNNKITANLRFVEIKGTPTLCVKLCCQVYNDERDWEALAAALKSLKSPSGRPAEGSPKYKPSLGYAGRLKTTKKEAEEYHKEQRAVMLSSSLSRKPSGGVAEGLRNIAKTTISAITDVATGVLQVAAQHDSATPITVKMDWGGKWKPVGQKMGLPEGCEREEGDGDGPVPVTFGKNMRRLYFKLSPGFLNAGSYGATPIPVSEARNNWDAAFQRNPTRFQHEVKVRIKEVETRLAQYLNSSPDNTKLVINANYATSVVFKGLPWEEGDRIVIYDIDYDATKNACNWLTRTHGVEVVEIKLSLPLSDEEILEITKDKLAELKKQSMSGGPRMPVLANFCHVTSKTGWTFPAKELVATFKSFGLAVVVDGAQAAGHVQGLDVGSIDADWYLGTVHKWMYSCQGVGFIVTSPTKHAITHPLTIPSQFGRGYSAEFEGYGLQDYSTWCSVGEAFDFIEKVCGGLAKVQAYCRSQAQRCVEILSQAWGTKPFQGDIAHYGCLPIIPLPNGKKADGATAGKVMGYLMVRHKITAFLLVADIDGEPTLCIRVTCQIYNDEDDWQKLAAAVNQLGGNYSALRVIAELGILPESVSAMIS